MCSYLTIHDPLILHSLPPQPQLFKKYGIDTEIIGAGCTHAAYNKNDAYNTSLSREIEIFQDFLLLECTDTAYPIFESKFETALTHNEKTLRDHLEKFLKETPAEAMEAAAWLTPTPVHIATLTLTNPNPGPE